jgi:hypothetical protein
MNNMNLWISFMIGLGYDHERRSIEEILNFTDEELEKTHNYIQWLFPIHEPSRFNMQAPTLTQWDVNYVKINKNNIKKNIKRSLRLLLYFWGFTMYDFGFYVYIRHDGDHSHWMYPNDHNHLRISRVIHFLRAVGMDKYAKAFHAALKDIYTDHPNYFSKTTIDYWEKIMG